MSLSRRFLPSLSSLRAFEALERLGTATAAAADLNLTQSAVSRQVQTLEAQLGCTLVRRSARAMDVTEPARRYATDIRRALDIITQASMRLHAAPGTDGISLAVLPSFGMRWLVPRLASFAARHPDVPVNLSSRVAAVDFATGQFDAAIRYGTGAWEGCHALLLAEERIIPVCAPDLLAGTPPADSTQAANALARMSLLHIQSRPTAWIDWLKSHGADAPVRAAGTFDQFSTITQAAIHGLGVALLPEFIAHTEIASGRLVPAFAHYTTSQNAYYLVWPKQNSEDPALRLFRDWITTQTEDYLPR